jgi:16S rRNA (uracil1498-N3)-methyltransferase
MHRFYIPKDIEEGSYMIMDAAIAHQVRSVLRMKVGDKIVLFSGKNVGWDYLFLIERITDRMIDGEVVERIKNEREPRVDVTLFQSLIKREKMEWIFEKGTEVGVSAFAPIISDRSIKRSINEERAHKIVKESAEQSGRARLPSIEPPCSFKEAVSTAREKGGLTVVAHEKETRRTLDVAPPASRRIALFIGPEGGFSEQEIMLARNAGFFITSLSRRVLRAETAAIVGSYAVLHRFGN